MYINFFCTNIAPHMATASRHLCRSLLRTCSRPAAKRQCQSIQRHRVRTRSSPFRQFSSAPIKRADKKDDSGLSSPEFDMSKLQKPKKPYTAADLDPEERAAYETMSKQEQAEFLAIQNHVKAVMESDEVAEASEEQAQMIARQVDRETVAPDLVEQRNLLALKDGYWQEDEDDEFGQVPDDDDEFSDDHITSVAESELEVHREIREYTRIAAWDLPMLLQYTKPFELPDMKKSPLRFRYTTYMGEQHPAASKIVVEFTTKELAASAGLSEVQRSKLIKLLGVRYNPDKDLVRMSSEKFENQAQNKRYLGDLVNKLVAESKTGDMFEDIPFDFRHHKPKPQHVFPENWKLSNQQEVKRLVEERQAVKSISEGEGEKVPVDGKRLMEAHVRARATQPAFARSF